MAALETKTCRPLDRHDDTSPALPISSAVASRRVGEQGRARSGHQAATMRSLHPHRTLGSVSTTQSEHVNSAPVQLRDAHNAVTAPRVCDHHDRRVPTPSRACTWLRWPQAATRPRASPRAAPSLPATRFEIDFLLLSTAGTM